MNIIVNVMKTSIGWYIIIIFMSTPDFAKAWFINQGGTPPIVIIQYLNGTLPIKQHYGNTYC